MNHIANGYKQQWQARARRSSELKLESLLEFRDILGDARAEGYPPLMELYAEAAPAMLCAVDTLRRDIAAIREYPEDVLRGWLANGLSFDHLETANQLGEIAHKAPADLLHEAIDPGNATGDAMTVRELVSHALGERPMPTPMYWVNRLFTSIVGVPQRLNWNDEKTSRFHDWLEAGKDFFK